MLFISWKDDFNKKHWSQWEMFSFFLFMFSNIYFWVSYSDFTCTASRLRQKSDSLQVGGPNCLSWLSSFGLRATELSIQPNSEKKHRTATEQRSPDPFLYSPGQTFVCALNTQPGLSPMQIQWYQPIKTLPIASRYSKAMGLFLLLFSFILKWKRYFYIKPYENWKFS